MAKTIYLSKLVLKNFQTYKTATFNFTSKLNFIAAPNGSGKSSITNAINFLCLGTAKTINKNCELDQYIRFGEQLAFVEGYFVKNGNTTVIKREIRSKQSKYYINGKQATKKDVSEFMKNNCIDVNNMTQFLPQEKVSEFAKLSSEELMNEVLQTLDNFAINLLRHEVIGNEKQLDELIMTINHLNEMQLGNKKIVDSLKEEVMKYEEMNLKRRRIDLLELKVQYINYNDLLSNIKNESMKIETNEELIKQSENEINKIAKQIEALENSKENSAFKSYVKDFEAKNLSLSDFMELIENEIQACEILNVDIANLEKKKETRKKELELLKEKTKIYNEKLAKIKKINMTEVEKTLFDRLTLEIDKFRANNECMDQILKADSTVENNKNQALNFESHLSKIIDNLHEHKINIVKEEKQIHEKSLKTNIEYEKLQKLKIEFGQTEQLKLNNLKNSNKHCYEGVCWLRKNQQLFKQEILEPAFLHVNIKNMEYIKEIENCISYNMLVTFVCQNDNDFTTFTKLVKDEQKLNVNVMVLTDFNDNTDSTKIRQLGFDGTVLDFIETRKEYVNLFCLLGNVHRIPISKRKMDDANLFEKYDYKKMIINERYLEVKRSRYDKRDCVMTDSGLRRKNIFGNESAKKEIEDIERRITEIKVNREDFAKKVKTIFTQKQSIEDALNKFYNYKSEYREKHQEMTEYNVLKTKLTKYIKENDEKIIEYSCNKAIDNEITEIQQKVNEKNLEIKNMVLQSDVKMKNADFYTFYKELSLLLQAIESNLEKQMILADQKRTYEAEVKASKETISATKMHINELKKERDTSKEKIKNKIEMLQNNETGTTSATKIYTELERLNPSKQKLEDEIITLKADIDFIKIDKLAIEDYKTRQYKLKNIDKEKDQAQSNFDTFNAENNIKRECLIEKVNHFVDLIDSRFRYFFEKINSEGRIVFEHTNLKCDKWKLNIMVKFRKHEELAKLTSFRQSGGEKSVSTVLFLLAMQNLSKSPFKLVDEINQGMDRYNEKMINDLLIDLCEEEDSPQFFLITPKIVQGINFSDKVKIFVIYNNVNEEASSGFGNYLGSIN